jgi:SH3-like domain-containing protein
MPRVVWVLIALVLSAGTAAAERVRTTKSTKVYKRTGEKSDIVTKVAAGKTLNVVAKQGRWLKVRVNGRTGWVTQSSVVSLEARDLPRNTRRRPFVDGRSTRRGWGGGAPDDRVGADAIDSDDDSGGDDGDASGDDDDGDETGRGRRASSDDDDGDRGRGKRARGGDDDGDDGDGDDGDDSGDDDSGDDDDDGDDSGDDDSGEDIRMVSVTAGKAKIYPRPSKKAKSIMTVKRGAQLFVLNEHESGKWIRVEDEDGEAGWIAADAVEDPGGGGGKRPKRVMLATARLGGGSVGGSFTSNGPDTAMDPPPNYDFGSLAASVAIGGEITFAMKKDYYVGAGLEYLGCFATPGIRYQATQIGFKTHDVDVRLLGGYDFHKPNGMTAWARVGYHYGAFSVSDLANAAKIPSETFSGPTIGGALRIPGLTDKIGAEAALDLVYPGKRKQTVGNTDGPSPKAMAATLELLGSYAWKGPWRLNGAYQFGYAATRWSGASERVPGAMQSKRVDMSHVLSFGLGRAF